MTNKEYFMDKNLADMLEAYNASECKSVDQFLSAAYAFKPKFQIGDFLIMKNSLTTNHENGDIETIWGAAIVVGYYPETKNYVVLESLEHMSPDGHVEKRHTIKYDAYTAESVYAKLDQNRINVVKNSEEY